MKIPIKYGQWLENNFLNILFIFFKYSPIIKPHLSNLFTCILNFFSF